MFFKGCYMLLTLLLRWVSVSKSETFVECDVGYQCVSISSCSTLEDLLEEKNYISVQSIREEVCAREGAKEKVCCPTSNAGSATPSSGGFNIGQSGGTGRQGRDALPSICGRSVAEDKIINGETTPLGAYPWMAAIGYTEPDSNRASFKCAGAIISSRYVLTAAHCLDPAELGRTRLSFLHLGDYDLSSERNCLITRLGTKCSTPHIVVGVEETFSHPMYNKRGRSSDDVALIRLNETLDFDSSSVTIGPVCLPPKGFDLRSFVGDRKPIAAGWGLTEKGTNRDILLRVFVPIANDDLCRQRYKKDFVGNQLCVGGSEEGFDTCSGDSGGPLVLSEQFGPPFIQIGIASFGPFPCGLKEFPGVYTNVADYRDWIISNMRP